MLRLSPRLWRWWLVVAAVLLAAARWWHAYRPRDRPFPPCASLLAPELSTTARYGPQVWIPYPHQNLARLQRVTGPSSAFLRDIAALLGLPPPKIPTFGPFALPPAREMLMAGGRGSGGSRAAIRFYPEVAVLARLGGWLAANPWLKGGLVTVRGDAMEVEWDGSLWRLGGASRPMDGEGAELGEQEVLAMVALPESRSPLSSGIFAVKGRDRALYVSALGATPQPELEDEPALSGTPLVLAVMHAHPGVRALLLFDRDTGDTSPSVAVYGDEGRARSLISAAGALGIELPVERLAAGVLVAIDADTLRAASALEDRWLPVAACEGSRAASFSLWLQPRRAAAQARRLTEAPWFRLLAPRERRRCLAGVRLLEAMATLDEISLRVAPGGRAAEVSWKIARRSPRGAEGGGRHDGEAAQRRR